MKLGLGASIYMGGSQNAYIGDKYFVYSDIKSYDNGAKGYQVDSTSRARKSDRNFNGIDFQFSYDAPWGIVDLRGEYIFGSQQGVSNSSSTFTSKPTTVTYVRNFQGYYIYFIQSIYNTKHKIVFKYDVYDPNVDVKNDEIGYRGETNKIASSLATNSTDIKYSTIAIAWLYQYNSNVRIMANYSIVKNETSKYLAGFNNDLKDNVFTLRVQYKF